MYLRLEAVAKQNSSWARCYPQYSWAIHRRRMSLCSLSFGQLTKCAKLLKRSRAHVSHGHAGALGGGGEAVAPSSHPPERCKTRSQWPWEVNHHTQVACTVMPQHLMQVRIS